MRFSQPWLLDTQCKSKQASVSSSLLQPQIVGILCVGSIVSRVSASMRLNGCPHPTPPSCAVVSDPEAALAAAVLAGISSQEAHGQRGKVMPVKQ